MMIFSDNFTNFWRENFQRRPYWYFVVDLTIRYCVTEAQPVISKKKAGTALCSGNGYVVYIFRRDICIAK